MPVHTNSIGGLQFVDLQGRIQPRSEQPEVFVRPGKDDVTIRLTAVRGRPVKLRSVNYVADWDAAKTAINAYISMKDGTAYAIIQHTTAYGNYLVLDVVELIARAVTNVVGGLAGGEEIHQVCEWTVIHESNP